MIASMPLRRSLVRFGVGAGLFFALLVSPSVGQTTHTVEAVGTNFSPQNLTISVGDTVRWTNLAGMFHNVAQTDCPPTSGSTWNGGFRSGNPGAVNVFQMTFNSAEEICYFCETHVGFGMNGTVSVQAGDPWMDLGGGTVGIAGQPTLDVSGPLTAGSTLTLDLTAAPPSALMLFWLSFSSTPLSFFGGTIHPTIPPNLQVLRFSDVAGELSQSVPWPAGIPAGTELYMQFLIQDLSVLHEITLSNGMTAMTP